MSKASSAHSFTQVVTDSASSATCSLFSASPPSLHSSGLSPQLFIKFAKKWAELRLPRAHL